MRIEDHGLGVEPRRGWEVRIRQRVPETPMTGQRVAGPRPEQGPPPRPRPMLHAATVPLPTERADYGSDVTPSLGPEDVFVSLFEFGPEAVGTALFATAGRPLLRPADFSPAQLQRTLPGQSGMQYFFTEGDRAFCLYVVLGSHARRAALVRKAGDILDTLKIDPGARP